MTIERWVREQVDGYPLTDAILGRRSRRFAPGMEIPHGPFAFRSERAPRPLTEEDVAALVCAAAGFSGYALADLSYGPGEGGSMLGGMTGRVVASPDSLDTVSLFVIDDDGAWFVRRPQNLGVEARDEVVRLCRERRFVEAARRLRVRVADERVAPPVEPGVNFDINRWSAHAPGTTTFLPVSDVSGVLVNALLEIFEPSMGLCVVDERNRFRPAGLRRFLRSRGGPLHDDPRDGRVVTIQGLESSLIEAAGVEMGGMLHALGLMGQALGLGGFCTYARHEYAWLEPLGFDTTPMSSARYAGARGLVALGARLLGKTFDFPVASGLRRDGEVLLRAWAPPEYEDMAAAVRAFVAYKFGTDGMWRGRTRGTSWREREARAAAIAPPSETAVEATIAFASYVHERYGRFPAYSQPFRTAIAYQAGHVDLDFYDRFFGEEALGPTQRARAELELESPGPPESSESP
ncbi:MAG: hypothetical protein R3266_12670 [Gemmatimonadota bacterium]|nr:hypothetical protein [Gemmatimonadota bacterium]